MGLVSTHELLNRWAALQRDDGRGLAVGCARLLLPSATERRNLFGARLPGMQESFSLSWTESGRTARSAPIFNRIGCKQRRDKPE